MHARVGLALPESPAPASPRPRLRCQAIAAVEGLALALPGGEQLVGRERDRDRREQCAASPPLSCVVVTIMAIIIIIQITNQQ